MLCLKCAVIIAVHVSTIFVLHYIVYMLFLFSGGVSADYYPGPHYLGRFLACYLPAELLPVQCFSPIGALDLNTKGTILVDVFGLSIVEFRSVVTYESAMFGSNFRGFLIVFRYSLVNGPRLACSSYFDRMFLKSRGEVCDMDYTDAHVVCIYL